MNTQEAINKLEKGLFGSGERLAFNNNQNRTLFYSDRVTIIITDEPVYSKPSDSAMVAKLAPKAQRMFKSQAEPIVVETFHIDRLRAMIDAVTSETSEEYDVVVRLIKIEDGRHVLEFANRLTSAAVMPLKYSGWNAPQVYPSVKERFAAAFADTEFFQDQGAGI